MSRRKGQLSPTMIDHGWPHQVAVQADRCSGANHAIMRDFCTELSLCRLGHSVFYEDQWWRVFCFADAAHAALFRKAFAGEPFDPRERGRGSSWARWHKGTRSK